MDCNSKEHAQIQKGDHEKSINVVQQSKLGDAVATEVIRFIPGYLRSNISICCKIVNCPGKLSSSTYSLLHDSESLVGGSGQLGLPLWDISSIDLVVRNHCMLFRELHVIKRAILQANKSSRLQARKPMSRIKQRLFFCLPLITVGQAQQDYCRHGLRFERVIG
jgi:hypothetical protein